MNSSALPEGLRCTKMLKSEGLSLSFIKADYDLIPSFSLVQILEAIWLSFLPGL